MNPFKDSTTEQIKVMASVLIEKYYDLDDCGCGGSLHIVLDDKNISKEDVKFCLKWAEDHKDYFGYRICELLLELTQENMEDVVYNYWYIAHDVKDYESNVPPISD